MIDTKRLFPLLLAVLVRSLQLLDHGFLLLDVFVKLLNKLLLPIKLKMVYRNLVRDVQYLTFFIESVGN